MEATTFKISCKSSFCLEQFTLFHATQQHFYFCNFAVCCIYVLWQTFLTALYMFFAFTFLWQNTINGRLRPASYYKSRINKRRSPLVHVSWNPLLNRNNGKLECGPWNGPCDICNGSASFSPPQVYEQPLIMRRPHKAKHDQPGRWRKTLWFTTQVTWELHTYLVGFPSTKCRSGVAMPAMQQLLAICSCRCGDECTLWTPFGTLR